VVWCMRGIELGASVDDGFRQAQGGAQGGDELTVDVDESLSRQFLFKFSTPPGPPPPACVLAAGTSSNRRVASSNFTAIALDEDAGIRIRMNSV